MKGCSKSDAIWASFMGSFAILGGLQPPQPPPPFLRLCIAYCTRVHSPLSSKNLIDRNWLKKFMQVDIDVTYIYTDFGGRDLSGFGDITTLKTANFPFLTMDYSPWSSKNLIDRNWLKKFMQVDIDVTCIYTDFGGRDLSGFGDIATLKNGQFSLSDHGL